MSVVVHRMLALNFDFVLATTQALSTSPPCFGSDEARLVQNFKMPRPHRVRLIYGLVNEIVSRLVPPALVMVSTHVNRPTLADRKVFRPVAFSGKEI